MRRSFLLTIAVFFHVMPNAIVFGQSEDDEATKILKTAIAAHGGRDKLAQADKTYGKTRVGPKATVSSWTELPNNQKKIIHQVTINGEKEILYSVRTGDKGWIKIQSEEIRPMTQAEILFEKESLYRADVWHLYPVLEKKNTFQATYRGDVETGKRLTQQVTVSSKGQMDIDLFFEKKTGLLVEFSSRTVAHEAEGRLVGARFLEFKEYFGLTCPSRIMTLVGGEPFGEVMEVLEKRSLKEFPPGTFEMPNLVDEQSARILKTAISAHGGKDKLAMLEKVYIKTQFEPVEDAIPSSEQWFELPDKRKDASHLDFNTGKKMTAYFVETGGLSWTKMLNGETRLSSQEEMLVNKEYIFCHRIRLLYPILEQIGSFQATYRGEMESGNRLTQRVTVRFKNQFEFDLMFEKKTGLLVEIAPKTVAGDEKSRLGTARFLEFKEYSGLIYPSREASFVDGEKIKEHEVLELRFLREFPKGTFDRP